MLIYHNQKNKRTVIGAAVILLVILILGTGSYVWYEHTVNIASNEVNRNRYADNIAPADNITLKNENLDTPVQGNEPIKETIQYEADDRLIEHTFQPGTVPAAAIPGTLVDIKLLKDNEEDQIVVSKAAVVQRNETILAFYLNATEQEYLKDAANEGTLILTVYANDAQPASIVTYIPSYR